MLYFKDKQQKIIQALYCEFNFSVNSIPHIYEPNNVLNYIKSYY